MARTTRQLINIWGDTVDLRELLIGLACGSALGFVSYVLSLRMLIKYLGDQPPALVKGYALMGGIAGCILAAVITGMVFRPKRRLRPSDDAPANIAEVLRTFGLNSDEERKALQRASPKLIEEMKQLQIYHFFSDFSRSGSEQD